MNVKEILVKCIKQVIGEETEVKDEQKIISDLTMDEIEMMEITANVCEMIESEMSVSIEITDEEFSALLEKNVGEVVILIDDKVNVAKAAAAAAAAEEEKKKIEKETKTEETK